MYEAINTSKNILNTHASQKSLFFQPKLSINQPNDIYEQEADATADKVMRMAEPSPEKKFFSPPIIQRKCADCEKEEKEKQLQKKSDDSDITIQRQDNNEQIPGHITRSGRQNHLHLKSAFWQPKLTINQPNDIYEQEADAVADKVMRMRDNDIEGQTFFKPAISPVQRKCAACGEEEKLQRKEDEEEEEQPVQLKPVNDLPVQRKCAHCEEEEKQLHRKESGEGRTPNISPAVEQTLQSSGQPMDKNTRSFMERRFGYDFANVRIHNDELAHRSSKEINALAYTHGNNIVFGSNQYQPNTDEGKKLMAHELTHVVQQETNKERKKIQRAPFTGFKTTDDVDLTIPTIDIKYKERLELDDSMTPYLEYFLYQGMAAPVLIKYGTIGEGLINIYPSMLVFVKKCTTEIQLVMLDPTMLVPIFGYDCELVLDPKRSIYNAEPQVIPFESDKLDTSGKSGTLVLAVDINSNKINQEPGMGWLPGKAKNMILPGNEDYIASDFKLETFLPFVFGEDYKGDNFELYGDFYHNTIGSEGLIFNFWGNLSLPNKKDLVASFQTGETEFWAARLSPNILGAEFYEFPVERTPKGELSGKDHGFTFSHEWVGKGFSAAGSIYVSFFKSNFFVKGTANYNSKRANGNVYFIVADYPTARKFADEYLLDQAMSPSDGKISENTTDGLAFFGAGDLDFTLFDGKKETRDLSIPGGKDLLGDPPAAEPNFGLHADASFVVEPEGYITVAGQVKPTQSEFVLFPSPSSSKKEHVYNKPFELFNIPIAVIPGPLGTSAEFYFRSTLNIGAGIGPLTLSQILAEGRYSNRPGAASSELRLSGLLKLPGRIYVELEVCLDVKGKILEVFTVVSASYCVHAGVGVAAAVQARPVIHIIKPGENDEESKKTPPEYYIKGSFNFDAAGQVVMNLGDSLSLNILKTKADDPKAKPKTKAEPKQWKYKRNKKQVKNTYGGKDVEIPMNHTLGSEEIPRVSLGNFVKQNLIGVVKNMITQKRDPKESTYKEYFEPGEEVFDSTAAPKTADPDVKSEGYTEGKEERGEPATDKPVAVEADPEKHVFTEPFTMRDYAHTIDLIISEIIVRKPGEPDSIGYESIVMMQTEPKDIMEKIEEEKREIKQSNDLVTARFMEQDIEEIKTEIQDLKDDANRFGYSRNPPGVKEFPAVKQAAFSLFNYGKEFDKPDIGTPNKTLTPVSPKPTDVYRGDKIFFIKYKGKKTEGTVIDVVSYGTPDGKSAYWHIRMHPYGDPDAIVAPPAYDENGLRNYYIPTLLECTDVTIVGRSGEVVPARTVSGVHYGQRYKAKSVKAYPLRWATELPPEYGLVLVGQDRLHPDIKSRWSRAHLIHAYMCGEGKFWNLIPVPSEKNNPEMLKTYEEDVKELVRAAIKTGEQYWFKADVEYYPANANAVIGHYDDFVKSVKVSYGLALKGPDEEWWSFKPALKSATIDMEKRPFSDDLAPNRIKG